MLYIIGKVKMHALWICNCFGAWGSFWSYFASRTSKMTKNQLFHIMTCYISLESWKLVLLDSVIVFMLEAHFEAILKLVHQKMTKNQLFHIITCYILLESSYLVLLESVIVFGLEGLSPFWSSYLKMDLKSDFFSFLMYKLQNGLKMILKPKNHYRFLKHKLSAFQWYIICHDMKKLIFCHFLMYELQNGFKCNPSFSFKCTR